MFTFGLKQFMGQVGSSADNAAMESFFGVLKNNIHRPEGYPTRVSLAVGLRQWILATYNFHRAKSNSAGSAQLNSRNTSKTHSTKLWNQPPANTYQQHNQQEQMKLRQNLTQTPVLLPVLEHGLDSMGAIEVEVAGPDGGRGAVKHDIRVVEQIR